MKVAGFKASGIASGIKQNNKKDLGLIFSEEPATTVGVFTTNKIKAAPVLVTKEKLKRRSAQAILVNSGNANACTGTRGLEDAHELCSLVAGQLSIPDTSVVVSSTGIIGVPLPMERISKNIPHLVASLSPQGITDFAEAIMTTDTFPKIVIKKGVMGNKEVTLCGIAKGAGMIMPRMATLLSFILSDVAAQADLLEESLKEAIDLSFNRITIDGDTSTNDMVIMMANGRARNDFLDTHSPQLTAFKTLLISLCVDLATLILKDAEGSTKIINIRVEGACTCTDAQRIAYQIANSCLVKTAIYGEDANWGRIMAAIGNAEADIDPGEIDILFDNVVVVEKSVDNGMKLQAQEIMKRPKYQVTIKLHHGTGIAEIATTDLTIEYVKINSAYPT